MASKARADMRGLGSQVTTGVSSHCSEGSGWHQGPNTQRHSQLCSGWLCTQTTLIGVLQLIICSVQLCCCDARTQCLFSRDVVSALIGVCKDLPQLLMSLNYTHRWGTRVSACARRRILCASGLDRTSCPDFHLTSAPRPTTTAVCKPERITTAATLSYPADVAPVAAWSPA